MINSIVCLLLGHKWRFNGRNDYHHNKFVCVRCGKVDYKEIEG